MSFPTQPPDTDDTVDSTPPCPSLDRLEAFVVGGDRSASADLERHFDQCATCAGRVAAIREDHDLLRDLVVADRRRASAVAEVRPTRIPGYDLGDEIARGGQGVVVRGVQRATGRPVAIKLLTDGRLATSRQRRRFEHEIEAVSALRHPGIVTLYDGGIADRDGIRDGASAGVGEDPGEGGLPWFAMELVDGERLDEWAMARRHDREMLVDAFMRIVEAVAAAHRRGVIHRDLKPGNILVDRDGQPRVLDFGLAMAERFPHRGGHGDGHGEGDNDGEVNLPLREVGFVGTLAYAAPEQVDPSRGQVDARTDLHALGLILHEMLTGRRPFEPDAAVDIAVRLRAIEPPPDAPLRRAGVDADLVAIVRCAASPVPDHRYDSAAALLDDLRCRRTHRPLVARGDAASYLIGRFVRRHWIAVALTSTIALLLSAATVVTSVLLVQRDAQRLRAERRLEALTDSLEAADPLEGPSSGPGGPTVAQFIDAVAAQVDRRFTDDRPSAEAVRRVLGEVALNLRDLDRAEAHFEAILKSRMAADRHDPLALAAAQHDVARVAFFRGDLDRAEALYRDVLATRRRLLGARHPDVATILSQLAPCRRRQGDFVEAEALLREALTIRRVIGEPDAVAATINNLGSLHREMGDLDEAHAAYEESLSILRGAVVDDDDWRLAHVLVNLASVRIDLDRLSEAESALDQAESILAARVEPAHPKRTVAAIERVRLRMARGELERARRDLEDLERRSEGGRRPHAEVAEALDRLHEHAAHAGHETIARRASELADDGTR